MVLPLLKNEEFTVIGLATRVVHISRHYATLRIDDYYIPVIYAASIQKIFKENISFFLPFCF